MQSYMSVLICLLVLMMSASADNETFSSNCKEPSLPLKPLIQRKHAQQNTSVRLIGLFDVHEGENCHLLIPRGIEQMMMTIGELEGQLISLDLNTSSVGFDIYDTCSSTPTALRNLIAALREDQTSCGTSMYTGIIGPLNPVIQEHVQSLLKAIQIPYFSLQVTSLKEEIKAMSEVLYDLKWLSVALFTSSDSLDGEFREEAASHDICIASSTVLSEKTRLDSYLKEQFQEITEFGVQVAVVLGSSVDLHKLYEMATKTNSSVQYWLIAGLDTADSLLSIVFGPNHPVILFRKSITSIPTIDRSIVDAYNFDDRINRLNPVQSYIDYVNNCLKNANGTIFHGVQCQGDPFETQSPLWHIIQESVRSFIEDISNTTGKEGQLGNFSDMTSINIKNDSNESANEVEIWTFQHTIGKFSKHKELQIGHYRNDRLIWDKKLLNVFRFTGSGWFKIPDFQCRQNCHAICENFGNISLTTDLENLLNRIYYWKYENWVTILLTASCVGIILAIVAGIYFISRSCRENFEEGNQTSNIVLLIAVIFAFCCSALFLLQNDTTTCSKRIVVVGLAYAFMLSPILSRCLVLIASEMDGIHGHVSGLLQFVLAFFIVGVQVAMASYYWVMSIAGEAQRIRPRCSIHTKMTVSYLSYPMVLSFLCLAISPFCIRNLRNNREGLLLHLGSAAICLVWIVWSLLFFLLGSRWNEFTICFGIVGTASAILLTIFVPKVYRMVVFSAARDQGQVSMQPVIFASSSSRSPNLSIYESINHGYNTDKDGYGVDVFRDDMESPTRRKITHL